MRRPSAKEIIDTILEAFHQGIEPFDSQFKVVPSYFEIRLHPEVLQEFEPILPKFRERIRTQLDEALAKLNRKHPTNIWQYLVFSIRKLFRRTPSSNHQKQVYQRVGTRWQLDFQPSLDAHIPINYMGVLAMLHQEAPSNQDLTPRLQTQRLTVNIGNNQFSTHAIPKTEALGNSSFQRNGIARLSYTDVYGNQTYIMEKAHISIGRLSDENPQIDVRIPTVGDVSREHIQIRYAHQTRQFFIKDLSQYGTTLNGRKVQQSKDWQQQRDLDLWEVLPNQATIGLADVLFINFQATI